jgi:hypothetical protein
MSEAYLTVERWPWRCEHCGHQWETAYEARHADFHGSDVVTWRRGGHPSPPPWSVEACPVCGGFQVRMRPSTRSPASPAA